MLKRRGVKERVDRERRLEGLAVEVLAALGEREATIAGLNNALGWRCRP
jgi:hypothetical protein